ncbi:adenylate/guanylate cyclase domain-containing protein [Tropicimonas sp. TH_r6]|uniref:ATP-binding protein n=1 Tax=Tropicimonas sp. TH_r6 TaxID=3082085 RepID=UPI00295513EB|nr:adenylate/guanylate cyclase domain-containing protein [Tropicimonas sp. TH_r6]MDV7142561.1 adenylate/guanylate cyclase domain-containing protein [Tropicimonas sp. TH_r6]
MSLFRKQISGPRPEQAPSGERRQLTVLFYDIVGSTLLAEAEDPEALRAKLERVHEMVRAVLPDHGGSLEQVMGDGGMAYFGFPIVHEDAALSAVQAGLALLDARHSIPDAPGIRVGIATSIVVLSERTEAGRIGAVGTAPNLAARLEAAAEPNEILVSPATHALTGRGIDYEPVDGLALKGFPEIRRAWRAVAQRPAESRFRRDRHAETRLSGRSAETTELQVAWERAQQGVGAAFLIEGEPGIGKSRVLSEVVANVDDGRVILLQCQPRTRNEALFAIIQMYDRAFDDGQDRELSQAAIAAAETLGALEDDLTLSPDARRNAIVSAVADSFLGLAGGAGLLLLAEDLHWADEVTLAVLERIAVQAGKHAVLIVGTSRSDGMLDDIRGQFRPLPLSPMVPSEARGLIDSTATQTLSQATQDWIVEKADGNPLFIVELTAHACDHGGEGAAGAFSGADIGSLRDLLATRLERVGQAKRTAQIASVLGREYPYHLLARLAPPQAGRDLDADLQQLVDQGLKTPTGYGNGFSFRHALIRDVAYDSQLRSVRRALHGQIVDIVDADPSLSEDVPDVLLAEHCLAADRIERGLSLLLDVAEDAIRRSALRGPRALLERVLKLSESLDAGPARDRLQLRAYALLGPLITLLEGHRAAVPLYEQGQTLYFALPEADRAPFFPVLWGWWFTADDLAEQTRRSEILIRDVTPEADAESRLQALHCAWATLFDGGAHSRCLSAISDGLDLYDPQEAVRSRHLYGHDARVCGLGERALCCWMTGRLEESAEAIRACETWAEETAHLSSQLHALDIATQVAFFNKDLAAIERILGRIALISGAEAAPVITAKRRIFGGWMAARAGDRHQVGPVTDALGALREFGVLEDTPFYADIAAEVAAASGQTAAALGRLEEEIQTARSTGLTYWLPEMLRRKALLIGGAAAQAVLDEGGEIAQQQDARMLCLRNLSTRIDLGLAVPPETARRVVEEMEQATQHALLKKVRNALER